MAGRTDGSKTYYFGIDGLRFLAACLAASFHLCFWSWAQANSTPNLILQSASRFDALTPFTWFGWVGVEIFFVISGLVIANSANGRTPFEFAKSRLLRLYPGAWVCATVALMALLYMHQLPFPRIIKGYIASVTLFPGARRWVDGVYWTLTVEITFYLLVFALQIFRRFAAISILAWALTIWSGAYDVLLISNLMHITHTPLMDWVRRPQLENILLLRHGAFFAIGIWLWLIAAHRREPRVVQGLALAILVGASEIASRALEILQQTPAAEGQSPMIPVLIWLAAVCGLFLFTRFAEELRPRSSKSATILRRLGLMTYPMHTVIGTTVLRLLIDGGMAPYAALSIAFCFVTVLAWVVSAVFEPFVRQKLSQGLAAVEKVLRKYSARLFQAGGEIKAAHHESPALAP
jgi:peptidoglycan/LPS O-acetylase OafA/YrhL